MASGTSGSKSTKAHAEKTRVVGYDHYISDQLRKVSQQVKAVDLFGAVIQMATVGLAVFFCAAVADHWLLPGGLGLWGRLLFLAILCGVEIYLFVSRVLPLFLHKINPNYAALAIEQNTPTLKNSLINFLMLRTNRQSVSEGIYKVVERFTASRLADVSVENTIDRSHVIRAGYLLLAVFICCAAYKLFSPKDPLPTVGRVLLPWVEIARSTRVQIEEIKPGDATVVRGGYATISARITGLEEDEQATLVYVTADEPGFQHKVELKPLAETSRFDCTLPTQKSETAAGGIFQPLEYRILAGDSVSRTFRLDVLDAPRITVEKLTYQYPGYTGLATRTKKNTGDIQALEGSRVTVHARANYPLETAWLDLGCDGRSDLKMRINGDQAQVTFALNLDAERRAAEFSSYSIRMTNKQRRRNRNPLQHRIEVIRDLSPEVEVLAPWDGKHETVLEVPLDESVEIESIARDPDFALRSVTLLATAGEQRTVRHKLLDADHLGQFTDKFDFVPGHEGFQIGDLVEVVVTAIDNKLPEPNKARSKTYQLRVLAPEKPPEQTQQKQPNPENKEDSEKKENASQEKSESGDQQDQQQDKQDNNKQQEGEGDSQDTTGNSDQNSGLQEPGEGEAEGNSQDQQTGGKGKGRQSKDSENGANENATGEGEGDGNSKGVAKDGSEDGKAFEELLDELKENNASDQASGDRSQPDARDSASGQNQPDSSGKQGSQGENNQSATNPQTTNPQDGDRQGGSSKTDEPEKQAERNAPDRNAASNDPSSKDQSPDGTGQEGKQQQGDPQKGEPQTDDANSSGKAAGNEQSEDKSTPGGSNKDSQGSPQNNRPMNSEPADSNSGDKPESSGNKAQDQGQGNQKSPGDQGDGGQSRENAQQTPAQGNQNKKPNPDAQGGDPKNPKGDSGAGQQDGDKQGAPEPGTEIQPTKDKQQQSGSSRPSDGNQAKSPGHGKKESDSQGDTSGDRPGGGEEGGGQSSKQPGTGGAGENTAADQGKGQAREEGSGETSTEPGSDKKSDAGTEQSGPKQQGEGSQSRQQPGGEKADGSPQENNKSQSGDSGEQNSQPQRNKQDQQGKQSATGSSGGGGKAGDGTSLPESFSKEAETGEDANLEYTRKATDLVLEKLENQLKNNQVDQDLLDRLNWSEDDLRQFVNRWQEMKRNARKPGGAGSQAQQQLDEALRNLGLRREGIARGHEFSSDKLQKMRSGSRTSVPLDYLEQFRAYQRGVSRAGNTP